MMGTKTIGEYLAGLSDKALIKLWERSWAHLEKRSGSRRGSWDWPTLRVVYPEFYAAMKAINREGVKRGL